MAQSSPITAQATAAELQSGMDRQKWAENLILQLPIEHNGRNSWLLNYGRGEFAQTLRRDRKLLFNEQSQAINPPAGAAQTPTPDFIRKGQALVDQVSAVVDRLGQGQAYSSTLAAMNAFKGVLSPEPSTTQCRHRRTTDGPRVEARYGTAPTEVCDDCGMWRTTHHTSGVWQDGPVTSKNRGAE